MHTSKNEMALAPPVTVEIAPAYQKAMAATTQHDRVMVAESEVKSKFFTCDLEDMAGGVK